MKFITQFTLSPKTLIVLITGLGAVIVCATLVTIFTGRTFDQNHNPDPSNLRQISQASAIYAMDHRNAYPAALANNVWGLAEELAAYGILTNIGSWISHRDPANHDTPRNVPILLGDTSRDSARTINPEFRKLRLSIAVALGPLNYDMPDTVPIAWTRGLNPDGTWATHSPYGRQGGYIVFKDASVRPFTDLKKDGGQLSRFDGKGKTANILEALPPGSRISEYNPTHEEQKAWSKASRTIGFFGRN